MINEHYDTDEMDELIDSIGQWILEDEKKPGILNPIRMKQMQFTHSVLKRLAEGCDANVTYAIHKPFLSMGSITVEGESLEFLDCKWLGRAMEFASCVEVYPLSNGNVRLTLTFHDLVVKEKTP